MTNDGFDNRLADKQAYEEFVTIPQIKAGCPHKLGDSCKYPACVRGGPPFTNEQCFKYIEGMK